MLNSVVLAGNLGNDSDIHFNSEGKPIASFNLAFRAGKKKTGWIKVTCFNRLSEIWKGFGVRSLCYHYKKSESKNHFVLIRVKRRFRDVHGL